MRSARPTIATQMPVDRCFSRGRCTLAADDGFKPSEAERLFSEEGLKEVHLAVRNLDAIFSRSLPAIFLILCLVRLS